MTLARDWEWQDLTGYFWSEKFRGCRGYWRADEGAAWTRGGQVVPLPKAWKKALPDADLDFEIWAGYCDVETEASLATRMGGKFWTANIHLKVFDAPQASGNWLERMAAARRMIRGITFASCVPFGIVERHEQASEIAARIINAGGEGAMFRNPKINHYQRQRTKNLLRIKKHNIYEPWRQTQRGGTQARRDDSVLGMGETRHGQGDHRYGQGQRPDTRPVAGLDVSQFPYDPEIEHNIHLILTSHCDLTALTKRGRRAFV